MRDSLKDVTYFEERYAKDVKRFEAAYSECTEALEKFAQDGDRFTGKINLYHYDVFLKYLMKFYLTTSNI